MTAYESNPEGPFAPGAGTVVAEFVDIQLNGGHGAGSICGRRDPRHDLRDQTPGSTHLVVPSVADWLAPIVVAPTLQRFPRTGAGSRT
ncbi:MAG TPA: hypothetical protein VJ978_11010 [Nitriliruptoraceae bacterium]|nr:hypothetical protein [Nitriliruptoraceae bacterium]